MIQASNKGANEQRSDSEQIDLFELWEQLWCGKKTILASVCVVVAIAFIYIAVVKEKWTSTAIITLPDSSQIFSYHTALKVLHPTELMSITDIQADVGGRFTASISALSNKLDNQEEPEELVVSQTVKGSNFPLQITYVGSSAKEAQQKLTQYMQQTEQQLVNRLRVSVITDVKQQSEVLQSLMKTQTTVAEEQRKQRLAQIREALKYADEANIAKPQVQQTQYVTQDTMFLLGSEGLKAMVQNESTSPLVLPDNYFETQSNLLDIKSLKIDSKDLRAFSYVMKPDLPVKRDSPKRVLVLALSVLLGLIVGSGIVLIRSALRKHSDSIA